MEETICYFGDRLQFETVQPDVQPLAPFAKPLPIGCQPDGEAWPTLQSAAMATGAFPIFLEPRVLRRAVDDYAAPMWPTTPRLDGPQPAWPLKNGETWQTLNVDGGVIDNDPFDLAHDYLAGLAPAPQDGVNPRRASEADRAVLTVAPFPTESLFDDKYDCEASGGVLSAIRGLFSVLISQSRFFGESLALIVTNKVFSRFVIAPSDICLPNKKALQCGSLGAFGGFFDRNFRAHDYALGSTKLSAVPSVPLHPARGEPHHRGGVAPIGRRARRGGNAIPKSPAK